MMLRIGGLPLSLAAALLLATSPVAGPARAQLMPVAGTVSGLVVQGIPLPDGAEPFLAANLTLENLHALAPEAGDLGKGRLQAVVYEIHGAAPADELAAFYRREVPGALALALPGRVGQGGKAPADEGMRVLTFPQPGRYLALRSEDISRPARVTVAQVEGSARPEVVLKAVDALRTGGDGRPPSEAPALLAPPRWESESLYQDAQIQMLLRHAPPGDAAGPVVGVMRSLLSQARSLHFSSYRVAPPVPTVRFLSACRQEARRQGWRLLSVDAETPDRATALYRFREDAGMVMLRAEPGPSMNLAPSGAPVALISRATLISRLEVDVNGRINLQTLFRPTQVRPPPLAAPLMAPLPRGPFAAQRHGHP